MTYFNKLIATERHPRLYHLDLRIFLLPLHPLFLQKAVGRRIDHYTTLRKGCVDDRPWNNVVLTDLARGEVLWVTKLEEICVK